MKKLLTFASAALLLVSCASVQLPPPHVNSSVIDYSTLTRDGIFVTESPSVSFDYEAVGSIVVEEVGGWLKPSEVHATSDDAYVKVSGKVFQRPFLSDAFEDLKAKLVEIGANGIVNLKVTSNYSDAVKDTYSITVSGMAIRR